MTPDQKLLVQNSFEKVLPIAETAAGLFYGRLFALDPSLRPLFNGDLDEQGRKLMYMLRVAVGRLDQMDELTTAVQKLGQRHAGYGVKAEHYTTVGEALLWTLEQGLGTDFTPDTQAAWTQLYTVLAHTMQNPGS
jgi:hemoglobin-like flavoprotein